MSKHDKMFSAVPGYGFGCADEEICSPAGQQAVCKQAAASFPYPVSFQCRSVA